MKVFGRKVPGPGKMLVELPGYLVGLLKCLFVLESPLRFIRAYLARTGFPAGVVAFRDGLKLHLSGHPDDVATVFVVFMKREYGAIPPGSAVVDIGANIGVFSLYAARSGAAKVYAYEPNSESCELLERNIRANRFEGVIEARRLAVTARPGETVRFPRKSSAYNAVIEDDGRGDFETVETTDLETIVAGRGAGLLLKIDCEGSEYDILLNSGREAFSGVSGLRMEYHRGRVDELTSHLGRFGFTLDRLRGWSPVSGIAWYQRGAR